MSAEPGVTLGRNRRLYRVGILSVLRRYCGAALVVTAVAGCQTETPTDPALPKPDKAAKATCVAEGGDYVIAGIAGQYVCVRATPDAGKTCSAQSQCAGFCMADTRTCSPVTPMFGCHNILMDDGQGAGICID